MQAQKSQRKHFKVIVIRRKLILSEENSYSLKKILRLPWEVGSNFLLPTSSSSPSHLFPLPTFLPPSFSAFLEAKSSLESSLTLTVSSEALFVSEETLSHGSKPSSLSTPASLLHHGNFHWFCQGFQIKIPKARYVFLCHPSVVMLHLILFPVAICICRHQSLHHRTSKHQKVSCTRH
jgi:hypothetical protein